MVSLEDFRSSHKIITAEQFEEDEDRPVDLEFYPHAKIHAYKSHLTTYYIIEVPDGFHWCFTHPRDDVAKTLMQAEFHLHDFLNW